MRVTVWAEFPAPGVEPGDWWGAELGAPVRLDGEVVGRVVGAGLVVRAGWVPVTLEVDADVAERFIGDR